MFKTYAKGSLISDSVFLFWLHAQKKCEITIINLKVMNLFLDITHIL